MRVQFSPIIWDSALEDSLIFGFSRQLVVLTLELKLAYWEIVLFHLKKRGTSKRAVALYSLSRPLTWDIGEVAGSPPHAPLRRDKEVAVLRFSPVVLSAQH